MARLEGRAENDALHLVIGACGLGYDRGSPVRIRRRLRLLAELARPAIAFAYPARPDVDLWSTPDCGGDLIGNGHILAGDSGTFYDPLRPTPQLPTGLASTRCPPSP